MRKLINLFIVIILFSSCVNEPQAVFSYDAGDQIATEKILFFNHSIDADEYLWDFGDGNTSKQENPVHIYAEGGSYSVVLKAINRRYTSEFSDILELMNPTTFKIWNNTSSNLQNVTSLRRYPGDMYETIKMHGSLAIAVYTQNTITKYSSLNIFFSYNGNAFLVADDFSLNKNQENILELNDNTGVYLVTKKKSLTTSEKKITIKEMISKY